VLVTGTERRAMTSESGRYRLLGVRAGAATVQFRGIGFRSVTRAVTVIAGDTLDLDVELAEAAIQLDEVVVTGTGAQTEKRKLGNTVASISVKQLETAPVTNVSEVLQGREPGVVALPSGGLTGEGAKIRIRGGSSLSQSNEPIVYVDGVRIDNAGGFGPGVGQGGGSPSRLDDINPESIERIEVLKGAAAATLYGTEASNGVIQIFTKKGSAGPPRYTVHVEEGLSNYPNGAYEPHAGFARRQSQADSLSAYWGIPGLQPYQVFTVDLVPKIFETGHSQSYSLDVSGGSAQVNYYVAGRYQNENGPFGGEQWGPAKDIAEHKQANASLTVFPLDKFLVRLNSMYTETHDQTPDNNNNIYGTISILINSKPELANANNPSGAPAFTTVREAMQRLTTGDVRRFGGSVNANYRPFGSVALDGTMGIDVVDQMATRMLPYGWNVDNYANADVKGSRTASTRNFRQLSFEGKASWEKQMGSDISSSMVVGGQLFSSEDNSSYATGNEFPGPGVEVTGAGNIQTNFERYLAQVSAGVFGQEQIGWRNWAFLTLGARYDKHSAFGESAGGAFYPKASISIVPSDLGWWNKDRISTLRLRAAIGKSGLQPGAFDKYTTFVPQPSDAGAGLAPGNLGNPGLKPEVSTEFEGGFEVGALHDRAALDVTYWKRTVRDALVQRQFPLSGGFTNTQLDNIGQTDAHGWETGLKGQVVSRETWSLNLFANASYLYQVVTDMGPAPDIKVSGTYARRVNYIKEGYAPGSFFAPKVLDVQYPLSTTAGCTPSSEADLLAYFATPRSPDALNVIIDKCGQSDINSYIGKPWPDWSGAFGGDIGFLRRFRFTTLFEFRAGNFWVHDLTGAFRRSHGLIGRNTKKAAEIEDVLINPASTPEARLEAARVWATELKALTPVDGLNEIHKADFVRWREASLTYDVPVTIAGRVGANTMSVTVSGRNVALFTRYPGADPEMSAFGRGGAGTLASNFNEGINEWGLPLPRRYTISVRASF
jgi:TonB-linked SusC/RagA family outer membrane protein